MVSLSGGKQTDGEYKAYLRNAGSILADLYDRSEAGYWKTMSDHFLGYGDKEC